MKIAFLFAGQGAQVVGMGKDFYDNYPLAKDIYDKFPELRDLCFSGPIEKLTETKYAQPTMLLTSYIIARLLKENNIEPEYVVGLSLGEYTALSFADTWDLDDALKIVSIRGNIMQNALPLNTSKMAAVINTDIKIIEEALKNVDGICEIANYNCPTQIVITGDNKGIDSAIKNLNELGAKRIVMLNVSGAFHSSLLNEASLKLREELNKFSHNEPKYKVLYNTYGDLSDDDLYDILERQIRSSVRFTDTLYNLEKYGVDTFIEIGPGKSLSSFVRKTLNDVKIYNVSDVVAFNNLLTEAKEWE